ncbi:MAG: TadE/TadG family type IV pilus assembly protein [Acidimicrobiales bacterium]
MKSQQGSLTVFMAVLSMTLFVLVGLVLDGGRAIGARREAMDVAEQAARAGADQLSVDALRSGEFIVDPAAAVLAVASYLRASGEVGTAVVTGDTVMVHVEARAPTTILGMIGIDEISVSATASATNLHGVAQEDQ